MRLHRQAAAGGWPRHCHRVTVNPRGGYPDHHTLGRGQSGRRPSSSGPLAGQTVPSAIASADGGLRVAFTSGAVLSLEPDPAYEASSVADPDGALVVSTPGGKLAVWSAVKGDAAHRSAPPSHPEPAESDS
ncbi:DUF6188 family protein [Mycobacterium sp. WMMD1722]|uniref:DUF6188 family protein n=1 Tax=Mycobacterium sp. WMMD1722 TaxID=3404117 RepID=UPI003BF51E30